MCLKASGLKTWGTVSDTCGDDLLCISDIALSLFLEARLEGFPLRGAQGASEFLEGRGARGPLVLVPDWGWCGRLTAVGTRWHDSGKTPLQLRLLARCALAQAHLAQIIELAELEPQGYE